MQTAFGVSVSLLFLTHGDPCDRIFIAIFTQLSSGSNPVCVKDKYVTGLFNYGKLTIIDIKTLLKLSRFLYITLNINDHILCGLVDDTSNHIDTNSKITYGLSFTIKYT